MSEPAAQRWRLPNPHPPPGARRRVSPQPAPSTPRLTFDTFVVGGANRFTHAAASRSPKPGFAYNPLFVFGGSGLGKTHLLHSIGHSVLRTRRGRAPCTSPPSAS